MDRGQTGRYSKLELDFIRSTFRGEEGERVLYELRNVLFGFTKSLTQPLSPEAWGIVKKFVLSDLDKDVPFGFQADLHAMSLKTIAVLPPDMALNQILACDLAAEYLQRRLAVLQGATDEGFALLDLRTGREGKDRVVDMLAFKVLVDSHIDTSLSNLKVLANGKEESTEEKNDRIAKDSNK